MQVGNLINKISILISDGGDDKILHNVMGNPVVSIDAKGTSVHFDYDLLQRPVSKNVINASTGLNNTVEYMIYGEILSDPSAKNFRGKLYRHYDQAGRVTVNLYSIKGEPRTTERRVRSEYKAEANWPAAVPSRDALLETDAYITDTWYDALGRIDQQTNPDGSISKPEYHLSGSLNKPRAWPRGTILSTGASRRPKPV